MFYFVSPQRKHKGHWAIDVLKFTVKRLGWKRRKNIFFAVLKVYMISFSSSTITAFENFDSENCVKLRLTDDYRYGHWPIKKNSFKFILNENIVLQSFLPFKLSVCHWSFASIFIFRKPIEFIYVCVQFILNHFQ